MSKMLFEPNKLARSEPGPLIRSNTTSASGHSLPRH